MKQPGARGGGLAVLSRVPVELAALNLVASKPRNKFRPFSVIFGHIPAKIGPETRSNGSGSKNGAEGIKL